MNGSQLHEQKYATGRVKTWDVSTSKVFVSQGDFCLLFLLFLLRIFAHMIDFHSYGDAAMSLYSIITYILLFTYVCMWDIAIIIYTAMVTYSMGKITAIIPK